jgi:peptidylprolyl isomerase
MAEAKKGDKVKVHYTGKHTNGDVFDSSLQRAPLEFNLGGGQMIKGFEEAILGMHLGQKKTIHIPVHLAYGAVNESLIFSVKRNEIPEEIDLSVGLVLQAQTGEGQPISVVVKEINDNEIWLDANHPLAGKDLIFEIELVEIN